MTPAEWRAEMLAALAAAERRRDLSRAAAEVDDEVVQRLRGILAETAVTMPPLAGPERPEWVSALDAARILGVEKKSMSQRCRRGESTGIARKVGGRWQVRIDLMAPGRGRALS